MEDGIGTGCGIFDCQFYVPTGCPYYVYQWSRALGVNPNGVNPGAPLPQFAYDHNNANCFTMNQLNCLGCTCTVTNFNSQQMTVCYDEC